MSPRGGNRGGGRKKLETKGLRPRPTLNCRIDPDLKDWLDSETIQASPLSIGEIIDTAIRCLQNNPEALKEAENAKAQDEDIEAKAGLGGCATSLD